MLVCIRSYKVASSLPFLPSVRSYIVFSIQEKIADAPSHDTAGVSHSNSLSPGCPKTLEVQTDACSVLNSALDAWAARQAAVKSKVSEVIYSDILLPLPRLSIDTRIATLRSHDMPASDYDNDSHHSFYGSPAFPREPAVPP